MERREAVRLLEDELIAIFHQIERALCMSDGINESMFILRPDVGEKFLRGYRFACIKAEVVEEALNSAHDRLEALLSLQ